MNISTTVIGYSDLQQQLLCQLFSPHAAHAYLLAGPEHVGKTTMIDWLSAIVLCQELAVEQGMPCGHCDGCRKCTSGIHPDIHTLAVEAGTTTITVAQVVALQQQISLRPSQANGKVVRIVQAEQLNIEAANRLLKVLEEPPENTYFFLTTNILSQILSTIRSRCQVHTMAPLTQAAFVKYFDVINDSWLYPLSAGAVGAALQYQHNSDLYTADIQQLQAVHGMMIDAPAHAYTRVVAWFKGAKTYSEKKQRLTELLLYSLRLAREHMQTAVHGQLTPLCAALYTSSQPPSLRSLQAYGANIQSVLAIATTMEYNPDVHIAAHRIRAALTFYY